MIIDVTHRTRYAYSEPVQLDCQTIRLRPRTDGTQRVLHFEMRAWPTPSTRTESVDVEGNAFTQVWFNAPSDVFEVITRSRVETLVRNPFEYVLPEAATHLPLTYAPDQRKRLSPYLGEGKPVAAPAVTGFAEELLKETGGDTVRFLAALAARIRERTTPIMRKEGPPWPAEATLELRTGSCRDVTILFMEACRAMGMAARFVSGYHLLTGEGVNHELHAWAEVYLPGVGWRGYDATTGLAVADRHVPVAAAAAPADATPITGTFRGPPVKVTLTADVGVRAVEDG